MNTTEHHEKLGGDITQYNFETVINLPVHVDTSEDNYTIFNTEPKFYFSCFIIDDEKEYNLDDELVYRTFETDLIKPLHLLKQDSSLISLNNGKVFVMEEYEYIGEELTTV